MTDRPLHLRAARVLTGDGLEPIRDGAIVIAEGRVSSVGPSRTVAAPQGSVARDLGDVTLMPGLIDMHAHLTSYTRLPASSYDRATAYAFQAAANLRAALERGVTTIRDVGTYGDVGPAARDAVASGDVPGPRVYPARNIICMTGGHGSEGEPGAVRQADGPDDCRRAVREQIRGGAHLIKVTTNGPLDIPELTQQELDAIVDEAHNAGRRVACHASILESARKALRAGVDTIEHGCELDDECVATMRERKVTLVPTLLVLAKLMERYDEWSTVPMFKAIPRRHAASRASFERALAAGVRIATGVDASPGICEFADVASEAKHLVDFGMSAADAVRAATTNAADAIGVTGELGSLAPGKAADVIAVEGDPTVDIAALARVRLVVAAGTIRVDRVGAIRPPS